MNPPGISIVASGPSLCRGLVHVWHLTDQVYKYTHTTEALGGYWSAEFTIRGGRNLMDDWLQDGLGRHIEVYDDTLSKIWEGFVNKLSVNYGPLSAIRGPLMDVANRVSVTYSTITYDEDDNPIVGTRVTTDDAEDTDSQDVWGILPKMLSTGGVEADEADDIAAAYLDNHSLPRTSKDWRSDIESETSVTVECLGYVHWLNWPYTLTTGGTMNASAKIIDILGDTPNVAWLAFDTSHVDTNALQVQAWEDEDKLAWSVVKNVAARGGTSYERWLFGIYDNLEAYYQAAPTDVLYQQRLSQPRSRIEIAGGDQVTEVYPWKVLPGKWIIFPDFLIGQATELDLRDDPRAMFIESVKYTMPWGLALKGGSVDTIDALIAQLGLSGIGA